MRFVPSPMPRLLIPSHDDAEKPADTRKPKDPPLAKLAGIFDLDSDIVTAGPGAERWFQSAGHLPVAAFDRPEHRVDPSWLAKAAAFCDLAVFLGGFAGTALKAASECREAARRASRPVPILFHGPYTPDAAKSVSGGPFQGLLIQEPDPEDDPSIAAEKLRRACSCLPSELLLGVKGWSVAPLLCITARLEVLVSVPPQSVEYVLIRDREPLRNMPPPGTLLVSRETEERPWWAWDGNEYLTTGPESLWWRPWARDPRTVV